MTSCEKFLTEDARGIQNLDTYFENEQQVAAYVAGCYNNITFFGWWQIQNPWMVMESASDDLWAGNTSQECDFFNVTEYRANMAENGELSNFWQYRYKGIMNCNVGIERIPQAPIDENLRNRYLAELRFLRAYFYFDLVKNYGGVPLIKAYAMPSELEGITRTSAEECYKFIIEELGEAAKNLPKAKDLAAAEVGHATKGAALALQGKCYLYTEQWKAASDALKAVVELGDYDLLPEFGQVWSVHHNNSCEGVFEAQCIFDETYALGGSLSTVTGARNGPGDGWSWFQPTSDLENAFLQAGDFERLRWSIIKNGCTEIAGEDRFDEFIDNNTKLDAGQVAEWEQKYHFDASKSYIIRPDQHKSARIIRKFFIPLNDRPEIYNIDKVPLNFRIIRYADVLLMLAEAYNEQNLDKEAKEYLNKVRRRVNLDDVNATGDELRQAIRLERRLELCFENNRIYDIRRWKDRSGKPVISSIMGQNGSFVQYNRKRLDPYEADNQIESSDAKGSGFNEAIHLVFPIPIYEIQHSNGSIQQNPGY